MKNLSKAKIGETVYVKQVVGESKLSRRIMEMGLTTGVKVLVKNRAPLGDPMEIKFRGYCLSIGNHEARNVLISLKTKKTKKEGAFDVNKYSVSWKS